MGRMRQQNIKTTMDQKKILERQGIMIISVIVVIMARV